MLSGVLAGHDDNGDAHFDVPDDLSAEIQEIGKIRHGAHNHGVPPNSDFSALLSVPERVVQAVLDAVGLDRFLNFGDPVLLPEIESLVRCLGFRNCSMVRLMTVFSGSELTHMTAAGDHRVE